MSIAIGCASRRRSTERSALIRAKSYHLLRASIPATSGWFLLHTYYRLKCLYWKGTGLNQPVRKRFYADVHTKRNALQECNFRSEAVLGLEIDRWVWACVDYGSGGMEVPKTILQCSASSRHIKHSDVHISSVKRKLLARHVNFTLSTQSLSLDIATFS